MVYTAGLANNAWSDKPVVIILVHDSWHEQAAALILTLFVRLLCPSCRGSMAWRREPAVQYQKAVVVLYQVHGQVVQPRPVSQGSYILDLTGLHATHQYHELQCHHCSFMMIIPCICPTYLQICPKPLHLYDLAWITTLNVVKKTPLKLTTADLLELRGALPFARLKESYRVLRRLLPVHEAKETQLPNPINN
jgi:hypothetical protein